jgi:hypothetical protein
MVRRHEALPSLRCTSLSRVDDLLHTTCSHAEKRRYIPSGEARVGSLQNRVVALRQRDLDISTRREIRTLRLDQTHLNGVLAFKRRAIG